MEVFSFQVELRARGSAQKIRTPAVALSTQVHADLWHKRLGHMKSRNMELFRERDGSEVSFTETHLDCDICHVNKSL